MDVFILPVYNNATGIGINRIPFYSQMLVCQSVCIQIMICRRTGDEPLPEPMMT